MPRRKKKELYMLPIHEFYIAKWYIRGYELYRVNMYRHENSTRGYDEDHGVITSYKLEENMHDQITNAHIVEKIEYAFDNYVDQSDQERKERVWEYGMGRLKLDLLDPFDANDVRSQFRAWTYGFAKAYGIHTTREEN